MFSGITTLVNLAISSDARTQDRLKPLKGKILEIEITPIFKSIYIEFFEKELQIIKTKPANTGSPDVIVTCSISAFMALAFLKNSHKAAQLGMRFEGDLSIAEAIQTLFLTLDIDWEELLARITGDSIAYQMGYWVRKARERQRQMIQNIQANANLYLTEEIECLASKTEVNSFINTVDSLRSEVDRLEVRIQFLEGNMN